MTFEFRLPTNIVLSAFSISASFKLIDFAPTELVFSSFCSSSSSVESSLSSSFSSSAPLSISFSKYFDSKSSFSSLAFVLFLNDFGSGSASSTSSSPLGSVPDPGPDSDSDSGSGALSITVLSRTVLFTGPDELENKPETVSSFFALPNKSLMATIFCMLYLKDNFIFDSNPISSS
ncbi:hypothetical protein WICMUC_002792 [Wickerhamomyces mucosus]|uniref:Uncharacterized protein n=1 Tax=Wickerhamomyces mucosus TaxID=1378264 RepID=A0A9P8TDH8_9ASCO|nr:hypothetical protein WICMUC_002792 [Wickerhamomyces mucosus]